MLISADYADQNRKLHNNPAYGVSGQKYAKTVRGLAEAVGTRDILDYGCGKGTLATALGWDIAEYDPCIPGKDALPSPADLVVCTDVLEHIEPECFEDVMDDLARLTRRYIFLTVAVEPARKTLPDGRNAHILLRPFPWWAEALTKRFKWVSFENMGHTFSGVLAK